MKVLQYVDCFNTGQFTPKLRTNALDRWLSNNYHSEMRWMEAERRKNIESLLAGAKVF